MDSGRSRRVSPADLNPVVAGGEVKRPPEDKTHKVFVNRLNAKVIKLKNSTPAQFLNYIGPQTVANMMLLMLDIFYDSYLEAVKTSKSPNQSLTFYGLWLSFHLAAIVYYATASGQDVLFAMAELNQALIDENLFAGGELQHFQESRYETSRLTCDSLSALMVGGSGLSFYLGQYNFGIGFAWATVGSYLAGTISKFLHEQSGFGMLSREPFAIQLKKNHIVIAGIGAITLTAGGIAFAITNHALQAQLQQRANSDPHIFATVIEQGFIIIGLDAIISVARLLAADMHEELVERKVKTSVDEAKRIPGICTNRSALFHDGRIPEILKNRQVVNQLLAFCNTAAFTGLLMSLCNGPKEGSLIKVFGAMLAMITTLRASSFVYSKDLQGITSRIKNRDNRIKPPEEQARHDGPAYRV